MTLQKLKPCPLCKSDENLAIYTYERGGRHVECNTCHLLGPGEWNLVQAVRSWNTWDAREKLAGKSHVS